MNDTWDLSILYKGFDDPAFTGDMAALDAAIRSMNDLAAQAAALPHADLVHRYVDNQLQLTTLISKLFIFCSLRTSANTADNQEFLDADRLCQLMLEAQKKAYGDGLDQTCLHPYMWLCKGHYYSGSLSFYNFPYAFGGLFARGLYAKYQQEGEKFVPLYKEMLHATSVNDVEDTAKIAGIDLTDKAFWRQGLQSLADEIDLFCDLVK